MEQVVHTRRSSYRLIPNPRPLLNIYFCLRGTGHQSSPLLIYFRFGPKNCSHCDEDLSTSAAQRCFRNRAEITVLKCEQKSIRHGLRAGQVKELSGVVLNCDHSLLRALVSTTATAAKTSEFEKAFAFFQTLSRLFQSAENIKFRRISLDLICRGPHSSLERERRNLCRLFTSSIEREIRHFHVVVVQ